jgi:hypothetical protein
MADKPLLIRMLLLWVLIGVVRMSLAWEWRQGLLSKSEVSGLTLAFVPILLALEGLILVQSARKYFSKPFPKETIWDSVQSPPRRWMLRSVWLYLFVLVFAEVFGLCSASLDPGASFPVLAGSAMNLLLVTFLANTLAFHKRRAMQSNRSHPAEPNLLQGEASRR